MTKQKITVLGATGSIGESTLKVLSLHRDLYDVFAVSGYSQIEKLARICHTFSPRFVVVPLAHEQKMRELTADLSTQVICDEAGLAEVASHSEVDVVMAAIVGAAGLRSTMAAVAAGKRVLLANKESLVMAGDMVMSLAQRSGAQILPVDSEHNAIFQCMPVQHNQDNALTLVQPSMSISHISLTASGGPFLRWSLNDIEHASVADACKHPNWSMGQKISVDSASMMNKGLELIEASVLFGLPEQDIRVVIHPESIIHSAVHFTDGSVVAELGNPDMCTPIAHALAWPHRLKTKVAPLDFVALSQLTFLAPDPDKFPCLTLARTAAREGQSYPIVLNAANEVAVDAFLAGKIGFLGISALNEAMLSDFAHNPCDDIDAVLMVDEAVRRYAAEWIASRN